ncbi:MAG TPA: YHS domain-containing protein [Lacipirellulaceae bacterium]|nr:YHS domain-containing protein [Lacipirellulaceae bacterium]
MKTRWLVMSLSAAMLLAVSGLQAAQEESATKEFKATCPVSGKAASEDHVVKLKNGDKVYFCCDNCPKAFKAHPKKYTAQVNRQLLETGQVVQVACPFTGKPVNKDTLVDVGEAKAGFCCKNCAAKYAKADDAQKLKLMFSPAAFKKGFTHQTKCPVSGKPIDPEHFVEYKGKKVYFCCPHCPEAFKANPEKYLSKLPQFAKNGRAASND